MSELPETEAAIVTTGNMTGLELLLPESKLSRDDNPVMSRAVLYLTVCFMRFDDEEFVDEQVSWMTETLTAAEGD